MSKQFNKFLTKVFFLSAFIVLVFNIGDNLINANGTKENKVEKKQNINNFKKINSSTIGKTGVAITTNMGIRYKQRQETPATIYSDIFSISEVISKGTNVNNELIGSNMQSIKEYKNILKTNVKQLLNSSYDKPIILNAFIEQLEYRYVLGGKNIKKLNTQKKVFESNMKKANTQIDTLKTKISNDFKNNNATESLLNIDKYLELKKQFYYSRTYIVYINLFLSEYNSLSNYNKLLLDTLINNKDALIKDAFVVIPDSGAQLLKSFDLLYNESDTKK